ncbi:hypothetical protein [Mycoplasma sp. Mirounga ES2805-ORL]|uniref:hypothetical protein n=1 Tax=Mycoplasma sp. Mirounga ES2805-ORL TaxID=754514 RepID=UPI00197B2E8C|nr:hypothetical protein [Mycoplasma sp. Mirounga ES2805-ORL]QSF13698.1 hypothetical protein JXZ90_00120 [Mycoplasma sp. Mirounga ES2805-ORL]
MKKSRFMTITVMHSAIIIAISILSVIYLFSSKDYNKNYLITTTTMICGSVTFVLATQIFIVYFVDIFRKSKTTPIGQLMLSMIIILFICSATILLSVVLGNSNYKNLHGWNWWLDLLATLLAVSISLILLIISIVFGSKKV